MLLIKIPPTLHVAEIRHEHPKEAPKGDPEEDPTGDPWGDPKFEGISESLSQIITQYLGGILENNECLLLRNIMLIGTFIFLLCPDEGASFEPMSQSMQ